MKLIPLTQGKFEKVDDEDFEKVSKFKWCADKHKGGMRWYAQRRIGKATQRLHQFILPNVKEVDHKDRDGLNNQKTNLRPSSRSQNNFNRPPRKHSSKYKGVFWNTQSGKRAAKTSINGKHIHLGFL